MSEYQYYEFLAIDRRLSAEEMSELRSISSRAEITQTRFCNVYNYGDLKGSPKKMMEKYFDAHVYITNWGTYEFMLRFPSGVIDEEMLNMYMLDDALICRTTHDHLIVSWQRNDEEGGEWVDGQGWMDELAPIREEIESGDYRALYIGWLAGMKYRLAGDWEEDPEEEEAEEPPVPSGLGSLTSAQQALAKLLDIDDDLLTAASSASPESSVKDSEQQMAQWASIVPEREAREYLLAVLRGEGRKAEGQIRRRYRGFIKEHDTGRGADVPKRRTIGEIRFLVQEVRNEHKRQKVLARDRQKAESERKRREYLKEVAKRFPYWWKQADASAEEKVASSYDRAQNILVDLRDAYAQEGREKEFAAGLQSFVSRYTRRPALMRRLKDAGIAIAGQKWTHP